MVQRMGRTGRKNEGRVVLLACEGAELNGYKKKQAKGKNIYKHLRNGGMNSFDFHPSPRMVPHVFKPEVQFLEMEIEEFVPGCKKVKDDNPVSAPAYKTKLTVAETDLLAKYFASTGEIAWRPSLIAFPHFQAFPSQINKVLHSSRTGMLIETMQYLQGLTFSKESNYLSEEDKDMSNPCLRVQENIIEERFNDPAEEDFKTEVGEIFSSEFVQDDMGNVLVLSPSELPLGSKLKSMEDSWKDSMHRSMHGSNDHDENNIQDKTGPPLHSESPEIENFLDSSPCSPAEQRKLLCEDLSVVDESPLTLLAGEPNNDFRDADLSPRLTNFIKSGIVPESPVNSPGTRKGQKDNLTVSCDEELTENGNLNKIDVPCSSGNFNNIQKPVLDWNKNESEEMQTPPAKTSNTSSSKECLLDSGVKAETVELQCKFRRLRKHGDVNRKIHPESKEQNSRSRKLKNSRGNGYHTANKKGKKKRAQDIAVYIDEEAEISSEDMTSNDEEGEHDKSSYEDSFINDDVNPTSTATQADTSKIDMMAIYRRSLLSQSPFPRVPGFCTKSSPDSVVQSSRLYQSGSSSGTKHDDTPQTGLNSTARNPQYACDGVINSGIFESKADSRKRKLSYHQARSVPKVNLEKEFALLNETPVENSSTHIQVDRTEQNIHVVVDDDDDDGFYEGIDLDAVEEEAARLLRCKTECSTLKTAAVSNPMQDNLGILDSPSFDLGF